jgi:hypothetical protein
MDQKTLLQIKKISSELADVETIILLLLESEEEPDLLEKYMKKRKDLELKIKDLKEH